MKYDLHVGQLVRIGNEVSKNDTNLHKRGRIVRFNGDCPIVEMLDPFESGQTTITWCPQRFWEPCPTKLTCKSLL
nr:MAG TPA: hypothetical protein [Caudoviricetes sp.]